VQVRNVEGNLGGEVVDASGNPLPPCIVMERGEALDLWVARAQPDRSQAMSVRCSLSYGICFYAVLAKPASYCRTLFHVCSIHHALASETLQIIVYLWWFECTM
jgi:hypothetical protein